MSKRNAGMTMVEIAEHLGISRQRVYQLVTAAGRTVRPGPEAFKAKLLRKGK
jgi:predicted transcriptional regulator